MLFICVAKLSNLFYKRRLLTSPDWSGTEVERKAGMTITKKARTIRF